MKKLTAIISIVLILTNSVVAQKNVLFTEGTGVPHRKIEDEFLTHKKCNEWWYSTGYLEDEEKNLFTFQYTLFRINFLCFRFHTIFISVTDIQTHKHYVRQQTTFSGKGVTTNLQETSFGDIASIKFDSNRNSRLGKMSLSMKSEEFDLALNMDAQKAPVWQCDNGKLQMGIPDKPKEVTYYFSFTNMLANGTLILNGKEHMVKGKAWFDKQGGTYSISSPRTNWEWFSLRFFDNEEIMLFTFPQNNYIDGTYIHQDGQYERLNQYEIITLDSIIEPQTKYEFGYGWKLQIPNKKEEEYILRPKTDVQFNLLFYEIIADVIDKNGNLVGYCFVELLPGTRNKNLLHKLIFRNRKHS